MGEDTRPSSKTPVDPAIVVIIEAFLLQNNPCYISGKQMCIILECLPPRGPNYMRVTNSTVRKIRKAAESLGYEWEGVPNKGTKISRK